MRSSARAIRLVAGPSEHFVKAGYIFVNQDVRGRFLSEGELQVTPHVPNKQKPTDVDESSDGVPSMGSRFDNRDYGPARPTKARSGTNELQWVRGSITAIMAGTGTVNNQRSQLQWVRGSITAIMLC